MDKRECMTAVFVALVMTREDWNLGWMRATAEESADAIIETTPECDEGNTEYPEPDAIGLVACMVCGMHPESYYVTEKGAKCSECFEKDR